MRCALPRCACLLVLGLSLALGNLAQAEALFSSSGFRTAQYRSPTPPQAEAATTLNTEQLQALLTQQPAPVLIDVYKRQWLQGRFIDSEVHRNLPGSHWLANTGDGELDAQWQTYLAANLQRLSSQDKGRALVFYCRSDCWLSWNAVKRAAALGYTHLYWYRDGVDAWEAAGLPLQQASPEPMQ